MNSCDRRVRRLRFACQRAEHARCGRTLLEDALRTASLGDEGRMVVIRSLALGRISPHASAVEWSLRLEQRVRAVKASAVFAESPGAATAEAVWFPNEIEMWVALATRAARGAPCHEWFWRVAASEWRPQLGVSETLRVAFRRLVAAGGLPATFTLARRLKREGSLLPLLRALSVDDVRPVLPDIVESIPSTSDEPPARDENIRIENALAWLSDWTVAAKFFDGSHGRDARVVWLLAAALFSETAGPPPVSEVQRLACQAVRRWSLLRARGDEAATLAVSRPRETNRTVSSQNEIERSLSKPTNPEPPRDPDGVITACGGLFFLVPLFARLGIVELPGAGAVAWEALRLVLARCRRSRNDELERLLPTTTELAPAPFVLPRLFAARGPVRMARWRGNWRVLLDATERLPLAAWPRGTPSPASRIIAGRAVRRAAEFPSDLNPLTLGLALGAHRLCRRQTGLGLKTLVRRPARIAITDTHIDLFFRPAEADIHIRRAALDVDPGWIPWLGRVVSFHYTRMD